MKVILLKDVPKLGKKDEVKEVNQGHALNFLIPRKLVIPATPNAIAQLEKRTKEHQAHQAIADELIAGTMRSLNGTQVEMFVTANEQGHLFKKVQDQEIADAIKQGTGASIDTSWVSVVHPIKETGEHEITLQHNDRKAKCTLVVKKEA